MSNPKMENLLNLALETPQEEREKSLNLNVGYVEESNSWEVIVKYNGSLDRLMQSGIVVEELILGYAILTVPQALVASLADLEEIEYIEKPKRLFFEITEAKNVSCIPQVTLRPPYLTGTGCLIAVLDSGIDYKNPVFRNADGSSRSSAGKRSDYRKAGGARRAFLSENHGTDAGLVLRGSKSGGPAPAGGGKFKLWQHLRSP